MKQIWIACAVVLANAVFTAGCGSRFADAVSEGEAPVAPQYSEKQGLMLPEQTRQSLGLQIIDVTERSIASEMDVVLRIYRVDNTRALASAMIASQQATRLKTGQSADVILSDESVLAGKVAGVDHRLQPATGMAEVLMEIAGAPERVAVGEFVRARVALASDGPVMAIPREALLECSEGQFVFTVNGAHFVRTAVEVGLHDAEFVEVTDGLYEGDQVVRRPVMALWMTELAAVKGGQACCVEPPRGK